MTLVVSGDAVVCGPFNEDAILLPSDELATCGASAPNASCSQADFCEAEGCGADGDMFDQNGCRRTLCETDQDCGAGRHCYTTSPEVDGCLANSNYACAPMGDDPCLCYANLICGLESHCVDD